MTGRRAPHPFSLRQLEYAVAVRDHLSFSKAAAACHVSQPSLSAQIAELEDAVGVRLFERDRRRVLVTDGGQRLLARFVALLRDADDLVEAAKRLQDPLSGTLRIGVIPTVSPYLLPPATPRLRAGLPRLVIAWLEDKTEVLMRGLDAGEIDGAVVALGIAVGDLERAVIATDPFVLAAPIGHALASARGPATAADLHDVGVLLLDDGHCFRDQALAFCSKAKAEELEFRATSLSTLVQMVAGGAGITLLPALSVDTEAKRAKLALRPFAAPVPSRTLALVWRKGTPAKMALGRVAAILEESYPRGRFATGMRRGGR